MNIQKPAVLALANLLKNSVSETVTYRRGNDTIDGLKATVAKVRNSDLSIDPNVSITGREQDFIVPAGNLAIAGQLTLPKIRDEIEWTDENGVKRTFVVTKRLGDRCYRYSDQTRLMLRIFTIENKASGE